MENYDNPTFQACRVASGRAGRTSLDGRSLNATVPAGRRRITFANAIQPSPCNHDQPLTEVTGIRPWSMTVSVGFEPTEGYPFRAFEVSDQQFSTDRPGCSSRSIGRDGPRRPPASVGECHQNCAVGAQFGGRFISRRSHTAGPRCGLVGRGGRSVPWRRRRRLDDRLRWRGRGSVGGGVVVP